ncbi:MAG TPA: hypothetical protein VLT84_05890 [Acidobacteriota bacterium]|nr:hypothetical protein [Acidobacteriota bacterium]
MLLAVLCAGACHASPLDFHVFSGGEILLAQRAIADTVPVPVPPPPVAQPPAGADDESAPRAKSPGRAFLMNMLVPGTGHLYAGNKRGWIHLGLEGATWVTYLYYHDRGKTKEDEFEAYADANWDYARWQSSPDYTAEADQLIRDFAETNRQQYYEDIGKLPVYWSGWEGYDAGTDDAQTRRFYRGVRNDSNNFLKNARYAVVGGFVNRVVSAVDVLRIVKNRGRANLGPDTSIKFNMRTRPFSNENALKVTLTRRLY